MRPVSLRTGSLGTIVAIGLAALLFSLPAIYNGFPFVFSDTPWYLFLTFHPMRTPFYGLLISPLHWKISLWPVVFGQALLLAHLLYVTQRVAFGTVEPLRYLALCLVLALCTSLPWFTGQIMPDTFTAVLILASYLLAFGLDRLERREVAYVFLLLTGSITLHLSNVPLALGLLMVALAYKALVQRQGVLQAAPVVLQGGAIALAVAGLLLASAAAFGSFTLSPGGKLFLMARSIADGPGRRYLEESCPEMRYRICDYLSEMESDPDFILWNQEGPVSKMGGPPAAMAEAEEIFNGAIERYPFWHLQAGLDNFIEQLFTFDTGTELISYLWKPSLGRGIERGVPGTSVSYRRSRQSGGELPLTALQLVGRMTAGVSFVLTAGLAVVLWRRRDWRPLGLVTMITAALLGNAVISGVLSGPYDRYQSRIIWLLTFVAVAGWLSVFSSEDATRRPIA